MKGERVPSIQPFAGCAAALVLACAGVGLGAPAQIPATQPARLAQAIATATQPTGAPGSATDLKAKAAERRKQIDERWLQAQRSQRDAQRSRLSGLPIKQSYSADAFAPLSVADGMLSLHMPPATSTAPMRIAVDGSKALWMIQQQPIFVAGPGGAVPRGAFIILSRFDFNAPEDALWWTRLIDNRGNISIYGRSVYGAVTFAQTQGGVHVNVSEWTQWAQPPRNVFTANADSIDALRIKHPAEFRVYVAPLLAKFMDVSRLLPGPADVYSVFASIPADPAIVDRLARILPGLDADDPVQRELASAQLQSLGVPGVLAALRVDPGTLSEEQKVRLHTFIGGYRHRPRLDSAAALRDRSFLIDSLEFGDIAVRKAAKAALEHLTGKPVAFDATKIGDQAGDAADALRQQSLAPATAPATQPNTQPAPQS